MRAQQGAHQHRHPLGPHTQCLPGGQRGPQRPPQAAFSIGVKFCAAPLSCALPRQVCAWAPMARPARRMVAAMAVDSLRIWSSVMCRPESTIPKDHAPTDRLSAVSLMTPGRCGNRGFRLHGRNITLERRRGDDFRGPWPRKNHIAPAMMGRSSLDGGQGCEPFGSSWPPPQWWRSL
jgi:hypothetical protein